MSQPEDDLGGGGAGETQGHALDRAASAPLLDRAITPVAGRLGGGLLTRAISLAALALGCAVFAFAGWRRPAPSPTAPLQPAAQIVAFEPAKPAPAPTLASPGSGAPSLDPQRPASADGGAVPGLAGAAIGGAAGGSEGASTAAGEAQSLAQNAALARAARRDAILAAPILAFSKGAIGQGGFHLGAAGPDPQGPAETDLGAAASAPARAPSAASAGLAELDLLRQGSSIGLARARRLPDRDFLITAGSVISCTLTTAMDTAAPGYVSCLIGQDVFSDNGRVVLLEKGSKVLGEYRSGLRQGQARLFVLWSRIVTPGGAAINLASPASDALGRAGFDGRVDTHFWSRFGSALMFSLVDDTDSALAPRAPAGSTSVRLPSEAAAIALENAAAVAPSLRKPQGGEVAIFVASDLDFSAVYQLQAR